MSQKLALIIGNTQYKDTTLARLVTPIADVNALAGVLRAPEMGGFAEVMTLVNQPVTPVRRAIARFFARKKRGDLLLLYFSGHGVLDDRGHLYLAVKNTERDLLSATAIPAIFITDEMDRSRSRRQVLILDCCHSAAFARGAKSALAASVGTAASFEGTGYGRVVLTATDSTQFAWEGDQVIGQAENSVFTHHLVQGLRTGEADANADGWITLDEWYDYVYEQVVSETPRQTPGKWSYKQQGDLVVAHNPRLAAAVAQPTTDEEPEAERLEARQIMPKRKARKLAGLPAQARAWLKIMALVVVGAIVVGGLYALVSPPSRRDQMPTVTPAPVAISSAAPQPTPAATPTPSPVPPVAPMPSEEPGAEAGILVLLAPFTDQNGATSPIGNAITADIREKLDDIGELDRASASEMPVSVVTVNAISPQKGREEAAQVMAARGGDVLIWGWYSKSETDVDLHPRFELSEQIGRYAPQSEKFIILEVKKQQLETEVELAGGVKMSEGQLRQELSDRIAYLVNYTLGLIRYEKGTDTTIALDNFRTALQYAADRGHTLDQKAIRFYVADLLRRQDKKEEAIEEFKRAAAITTDSPRGPDFDAVIYARMALCYTLLDQPDEAEAALESAIQANPDYPEAHNDLATVYFETERLEQAISEFEITLRLLEETGLSDDPYYCLVQFGLAPAYAGRYEKQGKDADREKALEILDTVIACAERTGMEWLKEQSLAERTKVE